jgi:similar to stage IV sporulation protein
MRLSLLTQIRGYVKIEVRGKHIESFINQAIREGYSIWNVRRTSSEEAELCMLLPQVFTLRPLLKRTGCRMHVLKRYGFPFFLDKLGRRKFFAAGIIFFIIGMYLLSSLVWNVSVEGNERIATHTILEAAAEQGIYPRQWKPRLKDPDELSRGLLSSLPGAAWVGVDVKGTRIHIKIVETTRPDDRELQSPRHLVAAKPAEVTEILAEKGKPMVKPHAVVRKGEVLISGIVGGEQLQDVVVAKGVVRGLVWEKVNVEIPLTRKSKVYTGDSSKRYYVTFGDRALKVWGFGTLAFEQHESVYMSHTLQWRKYRLPIAWMNEKVFDVQIMETALEPADAKQIALEQARLDVLAQSGLDARLADEKVLSEKVEGGILRLEVLMEVEQDITEEQAIVPSS